MNTGELLWQMGIEPRHFDGMGRQREPSWETLSPILESLGLMVNTPEELPSAVGALREENGNRFIAPFVVGWEGKGSGIQVNPGPEESGSQVDLIAVNEGGEEFIFRRQLETGEGNSRWFRCPENLSPGYYQLEARIGGRSGETCLIVAPNLAYRGRANRAWGLFCPLYAIHSAGSLGSGDFTDLERAVTWMSGKGGGILGSLPLFASYLEDPYEPSPYAPVSRLFWNEFYADPRKAPNWKSCPGAGTLYESPAFQAQVAALNKSPMVDFKAEMKLRRSLFQLLSEGYFSRPDKEEGRILEEWTGRNPEVLEYARFRAAVEQEGPGINSGGFRAAVGSQSEMSRDLVNYFVYTQWLADTQINQLKENTGSRDVDLYMDLPLGVHPDGYDAWSYGDYFAGGVSGGAPPDAFFTAGQDWGFRPMHPWKSADSGHVYFRRIIRNLMSFSDVIRLDHVMNLHRLYWVPLGLAADQGAYVRYPANDLYAILMLESHRQKCAVVGEDLGTVPPEVRESMREHGVMRMFVGQFEVNPGDEPELRQPDGNMVASVNTHDTPTFSGFSKSLDILDRVKLGILDESEVQAEKEARARVLKSLAEALDLEFPGGEEDWNHRLPEVLKRWLLKLAESPAAYLIVNLEDFWLEDSPQNVPGTTDQKPNWKQKMKKSLEEIERDSSLEELLGEINRLRKG